MNNDQEPRKVRYDTAIEPIAPAVPLTEVEPENKRKIRWGRIICIVILLIVVGFGIYASILVKNVAKISTAPFSLVPMARDTGGRTNVLLLGKGDEGHSGEGLTDTIMLMSVNKPTGQVAQVSVPRDLRVNISGYGYAKINSANAKGGVVLAQQTVSDTLGVPINYYVMTNFSGLVAVIDAVGGLDVHVVERLYDSEYPCDDNQYKVCGVDIKPGLQRMDGATALKYARCRKGSCGDDYGRALRQQEIIKLLVVKMMTWQTLLDPAKLIPLTDALAGALQTNMGATQMGEFGWAWVKGQKSNPITLVLSTLTGNYLVNAPGSSDLVPKSGKFEDVQNRVRNIFTLPVLLSDMPD